MLFKIKEIGDGGLSLNLPVTADWLTAECPGLEAVPGPTGLTVRGQLTESNGDVFLHGRLKGDLEATCGRCLERARVLIDVPLTVTYLPRPEQSAGHGAEGRGPKHDAKGGKHEAHGAKHDAKRDEENDDEVDDVDVAHYDGDEIAIGPEVRDQLLLTYPITPLCREDCAGLCPVCGTNLNQRACTCETRQATAQQPFAAALGKLKL